MKHSIKMESRAAVLVITVLALYLAAYAVVRSRCLERPKGTVLVLSVGPAENGTLLRFFAPLFAAESLLSGRTFGRGAEF